MYRRSGFVIFHLLLLIIFFFFGYVGRWEAFFYDVVFLNCYLLPEMGQIFASGSKA